MIRTLAAPFVVAALCYAVPAPALAQEADLEQIEEARELYEKGTQQYKAGKFGEAERNFRRVYDAMRTTSVLFDIALAQEKQRRWNDAANTFDDFMRGSQRVNNRKRLERRVVVLRQRAIRQSELAQMANPTVREQGKPGGPGNEMMESYKDEELVIGTGEQAEPEVITPVPPRAAPAAAIPGAAPAEATEGRKSRWWVWAVAGGVAAVAVGVGVGLAVGLSKNEPSAVDATIGPGITQGLLEF